MSYLEKDLLIKVQWVIYSFKNILFNPIWVGLKISLGYLSHLIHNRNPQFQDGRHTLMPSSFPWYFFNLFLFLFCFFYMTHFLTVARKNLYLNIKREHEGEHVFRNSIDFVFIYDISSIQCTWIYIKRENKGKPYF